MSFNYGMYPYGMMEMGMMSGMYGYGGGNVMQSLKSKYGCEDCNRKHPYWVECATPVMPVPNEVVNPGVLSRVNKLFWG